MSANSKRGHGREWKVVDEFIAHGFNWARAHRSGQSIKDTRSECRIPGDIFACHPVSGAFQCEVGGAADKRLIHEFAELRARLLPGFRPMVVLFASRTATKPRWYTSPTERHPSLEAAILAASERAK